jgi:4-oxalocrotonate tautomerase
MPLVRIDLPESVARERRTAIADIVYQTLVDILDVPENGRFQIVTARGADTLLIDRTYLGIDRSDEALIIDITINAGRSVDLKKRFYASLAERLDEMAKVRPEDVVVTLTEVAKENWSFGNGEAQYA